MGLVVLMVILSASDEHEVRLEGSFKESVWTKPVLPVNTLTAKRLFAFSSFTLNDVTVTESRFTLLLQNERH
jgi:hypothetical protein